MEGTRTRTPRIIISGTSSHSGKTTITCGLLASLRQRGFDVTAYKTGPDYIDTEYLRRSGNCGAYNLDTWLMTPDRMLELFAITSRGHDISVIEGAMGLYDGGTESTASIAKTLGAPVILVIDARSIGESAAAVASGFIEYDRKVNIAGVILNYIGSDYHEEIITQALNHKGIKLLGVLRRDDELQVNERHLGLLPANENEGFDFERLRRKIEASIDLDEIVRIAEGAEELWAESENIYTKKYNSIIAVSRDEAFSFCYPESLDTLKLLGAEIIYFSPLSDIELPIADGYIFSGGFPEVFAQRLSENTSMLRSITECNKPILAECGGLMYLSKSITDLNGINYPMAGLIPFKSYMTNRPIIGYMTARALRDNIICTEGTIIRGHEFHYSRTEPEYYDETCAFELTRRNGSSHFGGYSNKNILASYLHINFFGNIGLAERFLELT